MISNTNIKNVKVSVGGLVKLLRKNEGLTQEQLGEKLGMSRITVQNLESGKNATMDTLLKALQHWDLLGSFQAYVENEVNNNNHESLY